MANKPIKREVVERFIDYIKSELSGNDLNEILTYFVKKGIIPTERVRSYVIVRDFQHKGETTMTDFTFEGEEIYGIKQKSIENIIYNYQPKFDIQKHII